MSEYKELCRRLRHLSLAAKTATDYEIKTGVFSDEDFARVKIPDALLPSKKEIKQMKRTKKHIYLPPWGIEPQSTA